MSRSNISMVTQIIKIFFHFHFIKPCNVFRAQRCKSDRSAGCTNSSPQDRRVLSCSRYSSLFSGHAICPRLSVNDRIPASHKKTRNSTKNFKLQERTFVLNFKLFSDKSCLRRLSNGSLRYTTSNLLRSICLHCVACTPWIRTSYMTNVIGLASGTAGINQLWTELYDLRDFNLKCYDLQDFNLKDEKYYLVQIPLIVPGSGQPNLVLSPQARTSRSLKSKIQVEQGGIWSWINFLCKGIIVYSRVLVMILCDYFRGVQFKYFISMAVCPPVM